MPTTRSQPRGRKTRIRSAGRGRRGRSLGLDDRDTLRLVRRVRAGFPFSHLTRFQKTTGLSWDKIAHFVQIPRRTLVRRECEGRLRPDESDRVLRASTVFDKAVDLFEGNPDAARKWLQTPQPGLGGEIPLDFATTEVGAREVEQLIDRIEDGVFA